MSANLQERTGGQWWQIQGNYVTVQLESVRKLLLGAYRDHLGMTPEDAKFYMDIYNGPNRTTAEFDG